jgi:hypothetical protein
MSINKMRVAEGEKELLCSICGEYWPADEEFFYKDVNGRFGFMAQCKACYLEKKYAKRKLSRAIK